MTVPNFLTFARLAATPVIVGLFFIDTGAARWAILILFVAAAATDYLDGWLARALGQDSDLGRLLDPIADKIMVAAVLLALVGFGPLGGIHLIPVVIILARELAVSGLREFLAERRIGAPVTKLAKWKTAAQMLSLALLLTGMTARASDLVMASGLALLWLAAGLTALTGWNYFRAGLATIKTKNDA